MKKHTPGPYLAIKFYHEIAIQQNKPLPAGDRPEIAVLSLKSIALSPEEQEANALLFAAAPEMFGAIEEMLLVLDGKITIDSPNDIKVARANMINALSKAKGGL